MAEADGLIIRDYRVFTMGHVGDIEHVYTLNKGKLHRDLVEQIRGAFAKASDRYVVTIRHDAGADKIRAQVNEQLLRISGLTEEQIAKIGDLGALSEAEMQELLGNDIKKSLGLNNGNNQKVIPMSELKKAIEEGWECVRDLPDGEVIIRLPNGH